MTARQKILAVANELRLCLGCAAGCCDSASVVLDQMLKRAGLRSRIVSGSFQVKGEDWPHYWVVCEGLIVDITVDQCICRPI
jgi:hypothetical protein